MPSVVVTNLTAPTAVYSSGRIRAYDGYSFVREGDESAAPLQAILVRNWSPTTRQLQQTAILNDLKTRTVRLTKAIELLVFPDDPTWSNYRVAESSRPDLFQASAEDGTDVGHHQIQVNRLAQSQVNASKALVNTNTPTLSAGDYTFDLTINDETVSVSVTVSDSDTNEDLLAKIGRQIDAASSDLSVELRAGTSYDQNSLAVDTSTLMIRSNTTGQDQTFLLADTSGNLVETLGLDRSSSQAGTADLEFNSQTYQSDANDIPVEDGRIVVSLLGQSDSESLIVKQGLDALVDQTADLVDYFNDYVMFLHEKRWDLKPVVLNGLMNEMDRSLTDIKDIGLTPGGWGRLGISDRFEQMLMSRPDYVKDVLTGEDGFFTNVDNVLSSVLSKDITEFARPITDHSRENMLAAARYAVLEPGLILAQMV